MRSALNKKLLGSLFFIFKRNYYYVNFFTGGGIALQKPSQGVERKRYVKPNGQRALGDSSSPSIPLTKKKVFGAFEFKRTKRNLMVDVDSK